MPRKIYGLQQKVRQELENYTARTIIIDIWHVLPIHSYLHQLTFLVTSLLSFAGPYFISIILYCSVLLHCVLDIQ
jgi:hypothetical protein